MATQDAYRDCAEERIMSTDPNPHDHISANDALKSEFANDPDLCDIVTMFVDELPSRVDAIKTAFHKGDMETIRTMTHQLRGSAGGYGFTPIGDVAGEIEMESFNEEADISALYEMIEDLATICGAAIRPGKGEVDEG